jgi:hypothetical protein
MKLLIGPMEEKGIAFAWLISFAPSNILSGHGRQTENHPSEP